MSRDSERHDLAEVRANAFAASLLLPPTGARTVLEELGKGRGSRERWELVDGDEELPAVAAEGRAAPGSQGIQLHDVVLLANRFGVSRTATIYQLKNLRRISQAEREALLDQEHPYLSWAFGEAAFFARRFQPRARKFYERKLSQRGPVVATRALAHKLCRAVYFMLRDQKRYAPELLFQ